MLIFDVTNALNYKLKDNVIN